MCPAGQVLTYTTTNRLGCREYKSNPELCQHGPLSDLCTQSANHVKVLTRHVWERSKERIDQHRLMERGRQIYQQRQQTVERSFADAKELHGHRYAKRRGLANLREQSLLCAACQNLKKIALVLGGSFSRRRFGLLYTLVLTFFPTRLAAPVPIRRSS